MATIRECFRELQARQARLDEAEKRGWHDVIPSEREIVVEFQSALWDMLINNAETLIAEAGDVDLGPLPSYVGLHFSKDWRTS